MASFFLGIDVSKGYSDFALIDSIGRLVVPAFQLDDTIDGHQKLYDLLRQHLLSSDDIIYCGMENTGSYSEHWFSSLKGFGMSLNLLTSRIDAKLIKENSGHYKRITVNDKISAITIAYFLMRFNDIVDYNESSKIIGIKRKWRYVNLLIRQRTQYLNHLKSLLYIANPLILAYCKNGFNSWVLELLLKYPTVAKLKKAKKSSVAKIPKLSKERAEKIVRNAKTSLGYADTYIEETIIDILKSVVLLTDKIEKLTSEIVDQMNEKEMGILTSFIGISKKTAAGLLLEIGNIERFKSDRQLTSFFGMAPIYKQSGDKRSGMHLSKRGSSYGRKILFLVTMTAVQHNPDIRKYYLKKKSEGRIGKAAIIPCMSKIIRIIYCSSCWRPPTRLISSYP